MRRIGIKTFLVQLLRRLPMPLLAILVGLTAGLAVWGALDHIQGRQVEKIFGRELQAQLDLRARESLIRFDRYLASYGAIARLLANHRRLSEYLEPLFWSPEETVQPVVYKEFRPQWLPDFFEREALYPPNQVLLTDLQGRVRERYQAGVAPPPESLGERIPAHFLDPAEVRTVIARFDDRLYLVGSSAAEDAGGFGMGYLVVLVPVDGAFLAASQGGVDATRAQVALVDGERQRILASIDPGELTPGSQLDDWRADFLVTSQSLPEYRDSDLHLLFATFVPHAAVEKMSRHVSIFERRQRGIAAAVFILVFTAVIYLVSVRLNKVLKRMTRFSQRALGIPEPGFQRTGNQLLLLEDWIRHFTQLVLAAREEMSRRHQAALRETEALKAAMMEASLDAIVTLDQHGRIIEFNPAAERVLGLARQDALGTGFADGCLPEVARTAFRRLLDRSRHLNREPRGRDELVALRGDGEEIPVELSIAPIELESERFYTLYIHDISSRKQAEREIKSLARFASESPSPILRVTAEGLIVYANQASRPLLLAWRADPGEALPPDWCAEVALALERGEPRERELELAGAIHALLFAPIRDLGYVNIYARDITAVRRAEQEARQHQAELVHVCRLSTLGEVATGMAHELNQPLAAIANYASGCTRRLQSGNVQTADLIGALDQISAQARRAGEIIRRLRALVGRQPQSRADTDLNHLVREVCSFVEFETAKLGLPIELELHPEPLPVHVDLVQIEQVVLNLVRNALDALEEMPEDRRRLRIRTAPAGERAQVSVIDTGPGIPPERILRLFHPFFTTKEGGMGMGLAISQTIVEDHDGRIWAESLSGQGASFHLLLPLAEPASDAETDRAPDATGPASTGP